MLCVVSMFLVFAPLCACASSDAEAPSAREPARDAGKDARTEVDHEPEDDASVAPREAAGRPASQPSAARRCPVHVSLATKTYGTGDESQDDYAPRNVGAIWVSAGDRFVRTIALWGPGYYEYAETWLAQSKASRVDITTMATRATHMRDVQADWDCRDAKGAMVSSGEYQLNVEFTEAEMQGPLLTGDNAIDFKLGEGSAEVVRAPMGFFGEIRITPSTP